MSGPKLPQFGWTAALFALTLAFAPPALAKTTGVGDDPQLESGPCYEALVDKNEANPTTAPKRELGAACQAEGGDIDKAWARVIRLWGSDTEALPDYDSYRPANAPTELAMPQGLAALGVLLTYLVLGQPLRSAARLVGAYPGPTRGALSGVVVAILARFALGAAFLLLFVRPYIGAVGAAALIAWTLARLARAPVPPREPRFGSWAAFLAETMNDALGAVAGLAALALFAQPSWLALSAALAIALPASLGPVIALRRVLRATPLRAAAGAAALVAVLAEWLFAASPVSPWLGGGTLAGVIGPLAVAAVALAAGLALARPARLGQGGEV